MVWFGASVCEKKKNSVCRRGESTIPGSNRSCVPRFLEAQIYAWSEIRRRYRSDSGVHGLGGGTDNSTYRYRPGCHGAYDNPHLRYVRQPTNTASRFARIMWWKQWSRFASEIFRPRLSDADARQSLARPSKARQTSGSRSLFARNTDDNRVTDRRDLVDERRVGRTRFGLE